MLFILGYIIGSIITLTLTLTVLYLYFHHQKPIERYLSQTIAQSMPKGSFIQAPTDSEIARKDKLNKLQTIKNEVRLGDILD